MHPKPATGWGFHAPPPAQGEGDNWGALHPSGPQLSPVSPSVFPGDGNSSHLRIPCIISFVIRRLYVNNFRCLENFELPISGRSSTLLIGKNGSGKTTISLALQILRKIGQDTSRVGELVKPKDLTHKNVPMRFEIEVELERKVYEYIIAFEYPEGFKELRVFEERFTVDGVPVYTET